MFKNKIVLFAIIAVVLLGGLSGAAVLVGPKLGLNIPGLGKAGPTPTIDPTILGPEYPVKEMTVNLADVDTSHYLKVIIVLEFKGPDSFYRLDPSSRKPYQDTFDREVSDYDGTINDTLISVLSSQYYTVLLTPQGKVSLKQQIVSSLNQAFHNKYTVVGVTFDEFVMQ